MLRFFFYSLIILITFSIYIRAGRTLFHIRKQVRGIRPDNNLGHPNRAGVAIIERTEVTVTTEVIGGCTKVEPIAESGPCHVWYSGPVSPDSHTFPDTECILPVHSHHINDQTVIEIAPLPLHHQQSSIRPNISARQSYESKSAVWSYTKCALLYFTALLITWIPSTANRVYSVVHDGKTFTPLAYATAFVLPLQGLWNGIIYIVISWTACKNLFHDIARTLAGLSCHREA